jgi:hypothetical protein
MNILTKRPAGVLASQDPRSLDWCVAGRSALLGAVEFFGHQSAIPVENGIGFGEVRDLLQAFAS